MPIGFILADLLARCEQAIGVAFLDESGEAIETVCSDIQPDAVRMAGVLAQIHLRRLALIVASSGERAGLFHVEGEQRHIHALELKDDYLLLVIQRSPASVGHTQRSLRSAGEQLEREILS